MAKEKIYSLRKSKKILRQVFYLYKKKKKHLTEIQKKRFENILISLNTSISKKNKNASDRAAKNLEKLENLHLKKTFFEKAVDTSLSLIFAIIIAIAVRQMWFEPMIVPTGSMRPTIKEKDIVGVSKTDFSINVPLTTKHFYINPDLIKRGLITVFSCANMDIQDPNNMYFYIFPGKKQLVKRLIAKPKDTVYFYGGRLYGVDGHGEEILEYRTEPWFTDIEHIPFIRFEGKVITPTRLSDDIYSPVIFYQMNEPIALLSVNQTGDVDHEMITQHSDIFTKDSKTRSYYDILAMYNFAMARILTKEEVERFSTASLEDVENGELYLELTHHPTLKNAKIMKDELGRIRPGLNYSQSVIPLNESSSKKIYDNLYTARFCIKNGYVYNFGTTPLNTSALPKLSGIKNGCYEIQNGKAFSINFLGMTKELKKDHPLNIYSKEKLKTFFNLGIHFYNGFKPNKKGQTLVPSRYAYFRDKNLYLMGKQIFDKDDPYLIQFLFREYKKQSSIEGYMPFEDLKSPLKEDGTLNKAKVKRYGIKVPENMYLFLGDNHSNSADSRDFGFVPKDNLKGVVKYILSPPSKRWGKLPQPNYEKISTSKIIIWSLAGIFILSYLIWIRIRSKRLLKF